MHKINTDIKLQSWLSQNTLVSLKLQDCLVWLYLCHYPQNAHELEPIDTEKSQNISQGAVRDRKICMSSANTTDDRGGNLRSYLTPFLSL